MAEPLFQPTLQGPQAAGASPVAPVSAGKNPLFEVVGDVIEGLGKMSEASRKRRAEEIKQATLGEYSQKLAAIEDAQITGQWDSRRVNVERRKLDAQFTASSPQYAKELKEIRSVFLDAGGIGEAKEEEQLLQEERKAERKAMIDRGMFIPDWASPELEEQQRSAFRASRRAEMEFENLEKERVRRQSLKQETRADEKYNEEARVQKELGGLMTSHFTPSSTFVREIANRAVAGGDPKQLLLDVGQYFTNIEAGIAQASQADPSKGEAARQVFSSLRKMAEEAITNKTGAESLRFRLEEMQSGLVLSALSNSPQLQVGYVTSKLLPGAQFTNVAEYESIGKHLLNLASEAGKFTVAPDLFTNDNMGVNKQVYDQLISRGNAERAGKVGDKEEVARQLGAAANNTAKQLAEMDVSKIDPKNLAPVANYLASTEFRERVKAGNVNKEDGQKALATFRLTYEKDIQRGVSQVLSTPFVRSGSLSNKNAVPLSNFVNITFDGAGIKFSMKPQGYQSPVDKESFRSYERQLASAKQAVDQVIRASTHLAGRDDYAQFFEENKHILMPSYFPDPNKLKPGQVIEAKNGRKYKYLGGNYDDIEGSYEEVRDGGER